MKTNQYKDTKINARLTLLLVVGCILAGCSNEPEGANETSCLKLTASIEVESRATDNGKWQANDRIGLYAIDWAQGKSATLSPDSIRARNTLWTYGNGFTSTTKIYFPDWNNKMDLYAYYPHQSTGFQAKTTLLPLSVATNQSDTNNYKNSDFMAARTNEVVVTLDAVPLNFKHKMCKLVFRIKAGNGYKDITEITTPELTISKLYTTGTFDLSKLLTDGSETNAITVTQSAGSKKDITPRGKFITGKGEDINTLAGVSAIVLPQMLKKGDILFTITTAGNTFDYEVTETQYPLKPGTQKVFTITLHKTGISVDAQISGWTNDTAVDADSEMNWE